MPGLALTAETLFLKTQALIFTVLTILWQHSFTALVGWKTFSAFDHPLSEMQTTQSFALTPQLLIDYSGGVRLNHWGEENWFGLPHQIWQAILVTVPLEVFSFLYVFCSIASSSLGLRELSSGIWASTYTQGLPFLPHHLHETHWLLLARHGSWSMKWRSGDWKKMPAWHCSITWDYLEFHLQTLGALYSCPSFYLVLPFSGIQIFISSVLHTLCELQIKVATIFLLRYFHFSTARHWHFSWIGMVALRIFLPTTDPRALLLLPPRMRKLWPRRLQQNFGAHPHLSSYEFSVFSPYRQGLTVDGT